MLMNMTMLQERKGRRESGGVTGGGSESDEELTSLMRSGNGSSSDRRRMSHDQGRVPPPLPQPPPTRETRWLLFLTALRFLGQLLVEIGRRALRLIERSVPRYIAFVDRLLIRSVRGSDSRVQRALRLAVVLLLVLAAPYFVYRLQRAAFSNAVAAVTQELSEDEIRPHIMVDRRDMTPHETKRRAFLRAGGDGLATDDATQHCENTVQGVTLVTDSLGYVCTRAQQHKTRRGCCNESDTSLPRIKQFTCEQCDTHPPHCCDVFEHCVSCCMHPLNENIRREFLTHADVAHPVYSDPSALTVFRYCTFRCRTSSASVQHQNSYRSYRAFCYGIHRPLQVLPTVNSDGVVAPPSPESTLDGALDKRQPPATLEFDPFYLAE